MRESTNFKIRASSSGKIMTKARSKSDTLSATCKTYLEEWAKEQLYGRRKRIDSKYISKGIRVESKSIDFAAEHLGLGLAIKNDKQFSNEFMTGEPDVILQDRIIDLKNSWDVFSFPLFEKDLPNKDYYWQMQTYMALTEKDKAQIIYTLMDTPDDLIEKEINSFCFKEGLVMTESIHDKFYNEMTYGDIDDELKIKVFEVERNDEDIQAIKDKVEECREYINEL